MSSLLGSSPVGGACAAITQLSSCRWIVAQVVVRHGIDEEEEVLGGTVQEYENRDEREQSDCAEKRSNADMRITVM